MIQVQHSMQVIRRIAIDLRQPAQHHPDIGCKIGQDAAVGCQCLGKTRGQGLTCLAVRGGDDPSGLVAGQAFDDLTARQHGGCHRAWLVQGDDDVAPRRQCRRLEASHLHVAGHSGKIEDYRKGPARRRLRRVCPWRAQATHTAQKGPRDPAVALDHGIDLRPGIGEIVSLGACFPSRIKDLKRHDAQRCPRKQIRP